MKRCLQAKKEDSVATALVNIEANDEVAIYSGENILLTSFTAKEAIPFGNKIALQDIRKEEKVVKYAAIIGQATCDIQKASLVHVHNVKSLSVDIPFAFKKEILKQMDIEQEVYI